MALMHPIQEKLSSLPSQPGVYIMKGAQGAVLYVGKAKNLRARLRSYLSPGPEAGPKVSFLVPKVKELDFILTQTEKEALLLENTLIKKYRPRYNIDLKDDKSYLHILLDRSHPYPRFVPVRRPGKPKPGQTLLGPYSSASAMRNTLRQIQKLYLLRVCKDREFQSRKRPCLMGQMGRCVCACLGEISPEKYREMVDQAVLILQGRSRELVRLLEERMREAAAGMRFEEAALLRDRIQAIDLTVEQQRVVNDRGEDRDVIGVHEAGETVAVVVLQVRDGKLTDRGGFKFSGRVIPLPELLRSFLQQYYTRPEQTVPAEVLLPFEPEDLETLEEVLREMRDGACSLKIPQRGEKRQLLELARLNAESFLADQAQEDTRRVDALAEIAKKVGMDRPPGRIECFDISNLGGTLAVGSRVVFREGLPWKEGYRRYKIRAASGWDDYAMMYEVLKRRFTRGADEEDLPDLLLIDGGRGHLAVGLRALKDLGVQRVQAVSIAKVPRDRKTKEVLKTRRVVLAPDAQLPGTASWTPDSGADVENPGAGPALETRLADAREGARPDLPSEVQSRGVPAETPGFSPMEELSPVEEGEISRPGVPSETDQERMTDRIFRPGRVNPLSFLPHSPGLRLLQQIRDEAHRFAVTYQRALRSREMGRSRLDDIRGIGPRRKKALLKAFEDIEAICRASVEELAHVAGMNEAAARILWCELHAAEGSE